MKKPSDLLKNNFPFTPTSSQLKLFGCLDVFLDKDDQSVLLLKGYAGTGKTTAVSTIVKILPQINLKSVLLAPTGRAAKVLASYCQKKASTIHKKIYHQVADPATGILHFERQKNKHTNTVFIIDEASMLSDDAEFGTRGILTDLIQYIYEGEGNKIMLVGDTAQLPPVGKIISPALDPQYLKFKHLQNVIETELLDVTRQELESGILFNATSIRNCITQQIFKPEFVTNRFKDIYAMTSERLEDGLKYAYDKYGIENTVIICRSNKSAVLFNRYIRQTIFFYDNELEPGDILMIVKNNYTVLPESSPAGFLANGEFVEIRKVFSIDEMYGFRFATLELRLLDYPEQENFEATVLLDTLYSSTPSLPYEDSKKMYEEIQQEYQDVSKKELKKKMMEDPYLNALQVKFAYALTCHKSQGGQWKAVFLDQGYLTEDGINIEFLRWLYTGVTRATNELFLVNFKNEFFK